MTNESETIEQVFERCTSTDYSARDREEILKAMQEYADLQEKQNKELIGKFVQLVFSIQDGWITADHYWGSETHDQACKLISEFESLGKKLK